MKKRYYFKFMENSTINTEYLHFGEEFDILRKVKQKQDVKAIFNSLFYKEAKRVSLMYADSDGKRFLVIDSKNNKLVNT